MNLARDSEGNLQGELSAPEVSLVMEEAAACGCAPDMVWRAIADTTWVRGVKRYRDAMKKAQEEIRTREAAEYHAAAKEFMRICRQPEGPGAGTVKRSMWGNKLTTEKGLARARARGQYAG